MSRTRQASLWLMTAFAAVPVAEAGVNEWTARGPLGGDVAVVVADPAGGTVYAGTQGGGVYKSTDGASSWKRANQGISFAKIAALVIDPEHPSTLYAGATDGGAYRTTDGGAVWTPINVGFPRDNVSVVALAIDPGSTSTLYAGTPSEGVFKSTDGGATWTASSQGLDVVGVRALAVGPTATSTLYAGTKDGIRVSADGGATWSPAGDPLSGRNVSQVVVDPGAAGTVYAIAHSGSSSALYKSTDGAATWTSLVFADSSFVSSLALDPADTQILYAATNFKINVYRSTDGGETWSAGSQGVTSPVLLSIAVDPASPEVVYVGTAFDGGVFRSTDRGTTFAEANQGLIATHIFDLAVDPVTPGILYAASENSLLKSLDGGASWTKLHLGPGFFFTSMVALAIDPGDPGVVYAGTDHASVHKSEDGGATWRLLGELNTFPGSIEDLVVDPRTTSTVYAGTIGGLLKSADGGETWTRVGAGLLSRAVVDLAIDPASPSTLYASTEFFSELGPDGQVSKSTDGGLTFAPVDAGLAGDLILSLAVDPASPSTLYAAGLGGVYKTVDGGARWRKTGALPGDTGFSLAIDPRRTETVYVSTFLRVSQSVDGGSTWTQVGADLPNLARALAIDPERTVYAGTKGGGVFQFEQKGCVSDAFTLCLDDRPGDHRFVVTLDFETAIGNGAAGRARATPLDELGIRRGGILWFFDRNNPEVLVKVLDGCGFTDRFWVFYAGTTTVGFDLTVTDTVTGQSKTYSNPDGMTAATVTDTGALAVCPATAEQRPTPSAKSPQPLAGRPPFFKGGQRACTSDATTLCLDDEAGDGRFRVKASYDTRIGAGASGDARAVSLVPLGVHRGGVLWFFDPTNPEVLVKVLDGCALNGRFWVFYAATTNVGFTLEVEDTRSGQRRVFVNPDGQPAQPVADTAAFDTCDL